MRKKKIILISNTSWYLYNFKSVLIKDIIKNNFKVYLVAPYDKHIKNFNHKDIIFINWKLNRKSLNPFSAISSILNLINIYNSIKPDIIHHFTIKPCLYGSIAARFTKIKYIVNSLTGLGQIYFISKIYLVPFKWLLLKFIVYILSNKKFISILQNKDDLYELNLISKGKFEKSYIIPGSGVDTNFYKIEKSRNYFGQKVNILFPARLIKEKGLQELIHACDLLWNEGYNFQLSLVGFIDNGNNSCLNKSELKRLKLNKNILILGYIDNMKEVYEKADIVVLPSWREGLSKSLIEAASMECPIITTDTAGCRDVIDHAKNGLLVPVKSVDALKLAIKFLLLNPKISLEFGRNAREKVEGEFDVSKINRLTLDVYDNLLQNNL